MEVDADSFRSAVKINATVMRVGSGFIVDVRVQGEDFPGEGVSSWGMDTVATMQEAVKAASDAIPEIVQRMMDKKN